MQKLASTARRMLRIPIVVLHSIGAMMELIIAAIMMIILGLESFGGVRKLAKQRN